jgi:hypothetical protein
MSPLIVALAAPTPCDAHFYGHYVWRPRSTVVASGRRRLELKKLLEEETRLAGNGFLDIY